MNTYQAQEFNNTIAFITSIVMMGFVIGMVKPFISTNKSLGNPNTKALEVTEFITAFDRSYTKAFAMIPNAPLDHAIGLRGIARELNIGFNSQEFKGRVQRMINLGGESPYIFSSDRESKENLLFRIPGELHKQAIGLARRRPVVKVVSANEIPDVKITEVEGSITAYIPGIRATAELSKLTRLDVKEFGLESNNWYWFNRLINQSGIPHVGTLLLDGVLEYCEENKYSILNQVSAYGDISQKELENWYIRKGFVPVSYKKYGNALLKWLPKEIITYGDFVEVSTKLAQDQRGAPEHAMLRIQHSQLAQLYGFVAEHVGDITNRMAESVELFRGNFEAVNEKVSRTLRLLRHKYGFEREFMEQIETNLPFLRERGKPSFDTVDEGLARLKELGQVYADEHKKLVVANEAQRIARDAAVAIGEFRFEDAIKNLEILEAKLEKGEEVWNNFALVGSGI